MLVHCCRFCADLLPKWRIMYMVLHAIVICVFNNWINGVWLFVSLFPVKGKRKYSLLPVLLLLSISARYTRIELSLISWFKKCVALVLKTTEGNKNKSKKPIERIRNTYYFRVKQFFFFFFYSNSVSKQ